MHPVRKALESLQSKGVCPRLHVDVTHADAVCPDFVVEKWQQRLIIDLDPSYPLELSFTDIGVEANLSFGGFVTRCTFPFAAIYLVSERGSNRGQVFAQNIPPALRHEFSSPAVSGGVDPELTKIEDKDKSPGRRRKRRRAKEPEVTGLRSVPTPVEEPETASEEPPEAPEAEAEAPAPEAKPESDQSAVASRRAAFTVIDGGS